MNAKLIALIVLVLLLETTIAQTFRARGDGKRYLVIVQLAEKKWKGFPVHLDEAGLLLVRERKKAFSSKVLDSVFVAPHEIRNVKVRRTNAVVKGALIGAVGGGIVGVVVANAITGDKLHVRYEWLLFGNAFEILGGMIMGTTSGAAIGAGVGSKNKKRFEVGYESVEFRSALPKMLFYFPEQY